MVKNYDRNLMCSVILIKNCKTSNETQGIQYIFFNRIFELSKLIRINLIILIITSVVLHLFTLV